MGRKGDWIGEKNQKWLLIAWLVFSAIFIGGFGGYFGLVYDPNVKIFGILPWGIAIPIICGMLIWWVYWDKI